MAPLDKKGDCNIRKTVKQTTPILDGGVDEASRDKRRRCFREGKRVERADA
jgi:hypothetical protein